MHLIRASVPHTTYVDRLAFGRGREAALHFARTMGSANIPTVRFGDFEAGGLARDRLVATLGQGLSEFGFVFVRDHGVDEALLRRGYNAAERFFALPPQTKRAYEKPDEGRQRGYTSFGVEHAKNRSVADLKEFWHVGRRLPKDHPLRVSGDIPSNLPVAEVDGFGDDTQALFDALDRFSMALLRAIERYLGWEPGFFADLTRDGNSVLRMIHYPPLPTEVEPGAVRAAEHEDINLLTILPASNEPGLQLQTREGQWLSIDPPPGTMVCDTGDMMQLLTEGRLRATTHRVVNPPDDRGRSRYSMPLFCHPHPEAVLKAAGDGQPAVTGRSFLMERLRDIGVA